jgi:arylsulfatase A-like enzyme
MVDRWVGRLVERLESLGLMQDTAIIFTSDHGFYFGEHGLFGKARLRDGYWHWSPLYDEVARVPLMVCLPHAEPRHVEAMVGPPDLTPTILDLAGLEVPLHVHGRSLVPLLSGEGGPVRDLSVTSWPLYNPGQRIRVIDDMERGVVEPLPTTIRDEEWTLICAGQGQAVELYRTSEDPGQLRNVLEGNEAVARELHAAFIQLLEHVGTADELIAPRRQSL